MTRTIVESKTKTAIIGFDQPFCVIGERINPTGRKILSEELERGDFSRVEADAVAQTNAGAGILDVNSGAVFSNKNNFSFTHGNRLLHWETSHGVNHRVVQDQICFGRHQNTGCTDQTNDHQGE